MKRLLVLNMVAAIALTMQANSACFAANTGDIIPGSRIEKPKPVSHAGGLNQPRSGLHAGGDDIEKPRPLSLKAANKIDKLHTKFSAELNKYVSDGGVDYGAWKNNPKALHAYLAELGKISKNDYDQLTKQSQLALWINAYNAFTIKLVLDHYPIKGSKEYYPSNSMRQIDGFWEENKTNVCGRSITLEAMEHDVLRKDFTDPRTHFAVVCAAKGCAKMRSSAYTGNDLDSQLNQATTAFLSDDKNLKIDFDNKTMKVSAIFKWFPLDFANQVGLGKRFPPPTDDEIVASYLLDRAPQAVQNKKD